MKTIKLSIQYFFTLKGHAIQLMYNYNSLSSQHCYQTVENKVRMRFDAMKAIKISISFVTV